MAIISRRPGRWASLAFPPTAVRPRTIFRYANGGLWTLAKRVGFRDIARFYSIPDVWDLISYNFGVRTPEEVNWCLNHFLGCTKTLDGSNYCLDRNDPNPIVAIPPVGFKAFTPDDEKVRQMILTTLNESEIDMIRFQLVSLKVTRDMFTKVADAVRSKYVLSVEMKAGTGPAGVRALYSPSLDLFWVRNASVFDLDKRALIVHEALHAGMDITKQAGPVLMHEAAAHVAEAMRVMLALPDPRTVNIAAIPLARSRAAMRLALRIFNHNMSTASSSIVIPVWDLDYASLLGTLLAVPEYALRAGDDIGSNGI